KVARVTDAKVLDVPVKSVAVPLSIPGVIEGDGSVFLVNHNTDTELASLRYKLRNARMDTAEEPFEFHGTSFNRGSIIIRGVMREALQPVASGLGLHILASADAPNVVTHPIQAARIALAHTW